MRDARITNLYSLMDFSYMARPRSQSTALGHVAIIDVNLRLNATRKQAPLTEEQEQRAFGYRYPADVR